MKKAGNSENAGMCAKSQNHINSDLESKIEKDSPSSIEKSMPCHIDYHRSCTARLNSMMRLCWELINKKMGVCTSIVLELDFDSLGELSCGRRDTHEL